MRERVASFLTSRLRAVREYRLRQYVLRALLALLVVLSLLFLFIEVPLTEKAFSDDARLVLVLVLSAFLFALLLLLSSDRAVGLLLLAVLEVYFITASLRLHDYYFGFALSILIGVAVYFVNEAPPRLSLGGAGHRLLCGWVAFLAVLMALFIGVLTILPYRNHWAPTYDFGIFAQMFHYMKETGVPLTTCERDGLLSHFAVHFSPIYYLLLPLYFLFPFGETLLLAQGLVVASGLFPLALLSRKIGLSRRATAVFSLLYALYPALLESNFFYLHENCFLAPLLLWLLYFMQRGSLPGIFGLAALTLLVKEDAAVYVAVIGLYFLLSGKTRRARLQALSVLVLSVAYFLIVTRLMGLYGEGIMSDSRYGDYIYDGGGLFTVIKSVIQNPLYAVRQVLRVEKILFLLQMLVPLGFLPLVIRRPSRLVLLIPFLLVNLMTSYPYQYDIGFQYVYGSGVLLLYLAVLNYRDLSEGRWRLLLTAALAALLVFGAGPAQRMNEVGSYTSSAQLRREMDEALALIPEDATVAATTFLTASLAERSVIYDLEYTENADEVEYIAVDLRYDTGDLSLRYQRLPQYETVFRRDGLVVIFRNTAYLP